MNRELIEDLHQYFEQKENRTSDEVNLLNRLTEELKYFQVSCVSREDLDSKGFDTSSVSDSDMETLAEKMGDDYCTQLFWESMELIAQDYVNIPKYECPKCGQKADFFDSRFKKCICSSCGCMWLETEEPTDRYVLVEHTKDSKIYVNYDDCYGCYNSEDSDAIYIPENLYIAHTGIKPEDSKLFIPVTWPESQEYFEMQFTSEDTYELCDPILCGKAFDDFGDQSIWVPMCIINEEDLV